MDFFTQLKLLFQISAKVGKCDALTADVVKYTRLYTKYEYCFIDRHMMVILFAIDYGADLSVFDALKKNIRGYKKMKDYMNLIKIYGINISPKIGVYEYLNMVYHSRPSKRDYYKAVAGILGVEIVRADYMRQVLVDEVVDDAYCKGVARSGTYMLLRGQYIENERESGRCI